jgi:hypothetical protein
MRPGDRHEIPTVSEAVSRAAAICDPAAADGAVTALVASFELDDRPATAVDDLAGVLGSTVGGVDPEGDSPAASAAAAVAFWLASNPDPGDDRELVLRESVRLGFGDKVPGDVTAWLSEQGVSV